MNCFILIDWLISVPAWVSFSVDQVPSPWPYTKCATSILQWEGPNSSTTKKTSDLPSHCSTKYPPGLLTFYIYIYWCTKDTLIKFNDIYAYVLFSYFTWREWMYFNCYRKLILTNELDSSNHVLHFKDIMSYFFG